jgi:hypothetical protein
MAAVAYPLAERPVRMRPPLVPVPGHGAARVYRRRQAAALAMVVLVVLLGGLALRAALVGAGGGPLSAPGSAGGAGLEPASTRVHVVAPGETLWSIVRARGDRGDPRPVVDRLEAELGRRPLQVGQRLVLP